MNIKLNIPVKVETALSILNNKGFESYVVGGCVRDSLLGSKPHDWDITTSAKPEEISKCFQNYRTINTGLKHGTVTVIIGGMHLEITTYRIDGEYSDNRRPESVMFTDEVAHDLKRRDFTINALAYNMGGIIDLYGGIADIENKLIKCVGNPDERFKEDGLRILRALRFASVLNFNIDEKTSVSIHKNKGLLDNISKERITSEFSKLLLGPNFYKILIDYRDVIEVFLPELSSYDDENWKNTIDSMEYVDSLILKLTLLMQETYNAEDILKKLKYDGATVREVKALITYKDKVILPNKVSIKKQLNKINYNSYKNLLVYKSALLKSYGDKYEMDLINIKSVERLLSEVIENNECYSLKTLDINGEDLIDMGYDKGKRIGVVLNEILSLVIQEKLENTKKVLLDYVINNYNNNKN